MKDPGNRLECHITVDDPSLTPVELLATQSGLSRQRIKLAMNKGAAWLTRGKSTIRIRRATRKLVKGDQLHLYYDEKVLSFEPRTPRLVLDTGAYSVWYKPAGMLSQGSKWGDHCAIDRWVETNLQPERPAFIVHRLDRAASGLIILAHEKKMAATLSAMFKSRDIEKHYQVIVHGKFPVHDMQIDADIDGKEAISLARRLGYDPDMNLSLLDVSISTGRKHQIRRHLSEKGFPVVGDRLYGDRNDNEDLQLNAISLGFVCPVEKRKRQVLLPDELMLNL